MHTHGLPLHRLRLPNRPFRPPIPSAQPPAPRPFTHKTQLLLIYPPSPRPQLPFLHHPSAHTPQPLLRHRLRYQLSRHLTTERKRWIFTEVFTGLKWGIYFCAGAGLLLIIYFGIQEEYLERIYPTPPEWSFWSRQHYHLAISEENPDPRVTVMVDRAKTGSGYRNVMHRLEDSTVDGAGLLPVLRDEGDIFVEGLGKTGFDVTSKSEPWRRGYFECIMGAARGAEALDGWVRDTTRKLTFPPQVVIGPSNPRPKPQPFGAAAAPKEEDCLPAFESPEVFYLKALNTVGFSTGQRLEAALAYADWLDFKGLPSSAEEMYNWGLDIAKSALPVGVDNVVDIKTGIINTHTQYISTNLLNATTALGTHHARNNNVATALPIFLSVLRARRQLPLSPALTAPAPAPREDNSLGFASMRSFARSLFSTSISPAPPTGDEPPLRTPASICEEAGLMAHIGEVLFASSASGVKSQQSTPQASGLGWTRDAVELAETTLESIKSRQSEEKEARMKCRECLDTGMENWRAMVKTMLKAEKEQKAPAVEKSSGWLWGGGAKKQEATEKDVGRWERESKIVERKYQEVKEMVMEDDEKEKIEGRSPLRQWLGA